MPDPVVDARVRLNDDPVRTAREIAGGVALAAGWFVVPLAIWFALQLAMGIALIHAKEGW